MSAAQVLLVEDEYLIGVDVEQCLQAVGLALVGPARSVKEALSLIGSSTIDAALVDLKLGGESARPVAEALAEHNIPFAFLTAYGQDLLPAGFQNRTLIKKPFVSRELVDVTQQLLGNPAARSKSCTS